MTLFEQKAKWLIKLEAFYDSIYDTKIGRIIIWSIIGVGLLGIYGAMIKFFAN